MLDGLIDPGFSGGAASAHSSSGNPNSCRALHRFGGRATALIASLSAMLLAGSIPNASAQKYVFEQNAFATGGEPWGLVAADFNGDGKPDLATASFDSSTVSVLLGKLDGTFTTHTDYPVASAYVLVTGDFNGDGFPDLATVGYQSGEVSILLNNGDGTFQPYTAIAVPNATWLAAGDFNDDGKLDLVTANGKSKNVSILLGNGDGTFRSPTVVSTTYQALNVATGDFNRDGKLDLVVGVISSKSYAAVLFGNGDGTFQPQTNYGIGAPNSITVADLNRDGFPDIAVAQEQSKVGILLNKRDGTFRANTTYAVAGSQSVTAVDLNGDGKVDLVVPGVGNVPGAAAFSVLIGNGDGTFQPDVPYAAGGYPIYAAAADFNGDGLVDLAFSNCSCNTGPTPFGGVSVLIGRGNGTFAPYSTSGAPSNTGKTVTVADFNGDGKLDAAVGNLSTGGTVMLGNGDGTFQTGATFYSNGQPWAAVASDFNRDGKQDMAIQLDGNLAVLLGNGDGTFGPATLYADANGATTLADGDFNGDGKLDLVFTTYFDGQIGVMLGNGDGTFQNPVYFASTATDIYQIVAGDFNRDGKLDIAIAAGMPANAVLVFIGSGDGTFRAPVSYTMNQTPYSLAAGDLNHDGNLDLVAGSDNIGALYVFLGNGDGTFATPAQYDVPTSAYVTGLYLADMDGDGNLDVLASQSIGAYTIFFGDGTGGLQPASDTYLTPVGYNAPLAVGDFNGDGGADIVADGGSTATLAVYLSQPTIAFYPYTVAFGDVVVGTAPRTKTVTVNNNATAPLAISSVASNGPFTLTNGCPGTLGAGDNCSVQITFQPAGPGTDNGSLVLTDSSPGAMHSVPVVAAGTVASVTPASENFGDQVLHTVSLPRTVTLTNTSAFTLKLATIGITGPSAGDFVELTTCGASLPPSGSCVIRVSFNPTVLGDRNASLAINDNGGGSPQTVSLTGTGTN